MSGNVCRKMGAAHETPPWRGFYSSASFILAPLFTQAFGVPLDPAGDYLHERLTEVLDSDVDTNVESQT